MLDAGPHRVGPPRRPNKRGHGMDATLTERRYRLIVENLTDVIFTGGFEGLSDYQNSQQRRELFSDPGELLQRWRFDYFNRSVERLLGYRPEEATRLTLKDLLTPESYEIAKAELAAEFLSNDFDPDASSPWKTRDLEHVRKDGATIWCEVSITHLRDDRGEVVRSTGAIRDVSGRKRAEQALRHSETRFRRLVENIPDIVVVVDRTGLIQYVNHASARRSPEEILGYHCLEFVAEGHRRVYQQCHEKAFRTGQVQFAELMDYHNGWWSFRMVPMSRDGEAESLVVIATNITERKRAEEELQTNQQLLRQALDAHERERQLVAYEIHDGFVQPVAGALMSFEGSLEALQQDPDNVPCGYAMGLKLLRDSIDEARRLMSGLRPSALDEFGILSALENLVSENQRRGELTVEYSHDVRFNRLASPLETAIFRIVQEGLANARRHSRSETVRVRLLQTGDRVRVEVEDSGIGFDPENVPADRFGLRGIRERARLFGGQATIQSAPGKGTRILVDLPALGRAPRQPALLGPHATPVATDSQGLFSPPQHQH